MVDIYGRTLGAGELRRRVGDLFQLGGVLPLVLADGVERGVRAALVRSGCGLDFLVLLDRGMDIGFATYQGMPLGYCSATGMLAPSYYESQGAGWLRGFHGGLLATCGLMHFGAPDKDGEREYGQHDRLSYLPARETAMRTRCPGDDCLIEVEGAMRQVAFFGENLVLQRRLVVKLGEARLHIYDTVENRGYAPTPHRILYHVNAGFPLLDQSARLLAPSRNVQPADAAAAAGLPRWDRCDEPTPGFAEENYTHELLADRAGNTGVALVNPELGGRGGLGLYIHYSQEQLPYFHQWKMMGEGAYVLGMEPANSPNWPRARLWAEGKMPSLAPGERREYHLEIGVLPDGASIEREAAWIGALDRAGEPGD